MKSLCMLILLLSFAANANVVTGVFDVWPPEAGEDSYLILATDRNIYEVPASNNELVESAYAAKKAKAFVKIKLLKDKFSDEVLGKRSIVTDIQLTSALYAPVMRKNLALKNENLGLKGIDYATPMDNYTPTVVASMERADTLFRSMRTDTRGRSQCYNRAHVWAFELWKRYRLHSNKTWIFFTRRYINQYKWKWWFHVSPSVEVAGQSEEIVLDRKFRRNPSTLTDWKNEFIKNKAACPIIDRYSQYSQNQYTEYCYLLKSSMHYWQPYHIENLEKGEGEIPTGRWVEYQLDRAYKNGISWFHGGVDPEDLY